MFMMTRSAKNKQRQASSMRNQMEPGSGVRTIGGMYAVVKEVNEETVLLELTDGVHAHFAKNAIGAVLAEEEFNRIVHGIEREEIEPEENPEGHEDDVTAAAAVNVWLALLTFVSVTEMVFDCPDSGSILRKDSVAGSSTAAVDDAAARLMTPPPMFCGFVVRSRASRVAVPTSAPFTCAGVQSGCSCRSSADDPATCGVAMLVPWNMAKPPCRIDE